MVKMKPRKLLINSNDNTLFCTSTCNNRCIMCCQPPTKNNDIDYFYKYNLERIKNAPKNLPFICLTGGEPTLLGRKLISLLKEIRITLPKTDILLLTNGRLFSNFYFAKEVALAGSRRLFIETELHSDYYSDHDIIAGVSGSYEETLRGIYNIASADIGVTIRIIVCKQNYERLINIAEFIHKNLPFVEGIIFMGMECIGFAYDNYDSVWVEPLKYQNQLIESISFLTEWGYDVQIYNIPLCLLPPNLYPYSKKSISDWKNYFLPFCVNCSVKEKCCGLFTTSKLLYKGLSPIHY